MSTHGGLLHGYALACTSILLCGQLAGCTFFKELESAEGAEIDTDTSTDSSDGTGEVCSLLDDTCDDQDTVRSCDLGTGKIDTYDCGGLCGQNVNFTCIDVGTGQHGCWCVAPGQQKVYSCWELESCLEGCGGAVDSFCSDQCFARTTASTVRMFGALVHCAQSGCEDTCRNEATACAECINLAMAGGSGGCGLQRSVCDADENDEPWP
jgi:hypothetical protein